MVRLDDAITLLGCFVPRWYDMNTNIRRPDCCTVLRSHILVNYDTNIVTQISLVIEQFNRNVESAIQIGVAQDEKSRRNHPATQAKVGIASCVKTCFLPLCTRSALTVVCQLNSVPSQHEQSMTSSSWHTVDSNTTFLKPTWPALDMH